MDPSWTSRLRWRMRGAWMWPAFAGLTVFDGLLLHARPIAGDSTSVVGGLLLGCLFNLLAVAVMAPLAGAVVRRRWRPDLPRIVAHDYAGTALVVVVSLGLVAAGLAHDPAVRERRADFRAQAAAVRDYVVHQAPAYVHRLADATTLRLDVDLYRTCVPAGPTRRLCLLVNTDQSPPGIRRDPSGEPNESLARAGAYRP
ncbi:MAG: hypothetical protein M3155_03085 [Actinomycetota bacterium]|nr:hypothetical protein [Actinomycetota bacterium]